jgi:hypothetical protein
MSDAPNINRSTERAHGGIGGGLPLLSLPLLAAAIWAFSTGGVAGPVLGVVLIFLFLLVSLRLLFAAAERGLCHHAVRDLCRHRPSDRPALGAVLVRPQEDQPAGAQRHQRAAEGQRQARQPDRDRRQHRLARVGHRPGPVRRRRLHRVREHPDRDRPARNGLALRLRPRRGAANPRCAPTPIMSASACGPTCGAARPWPACRSTRPT